MKGVNSNNCADESDKGALSMKSAIGPRFEGGNVVVEVDADEYYKGVQDLRFSVVGRLTVQRGENLPTTI